MHSDFDVKEAILKTPKLLEKVIELLEKLLDEKNNTGWGELPKKEEKE